MYLYQCPKCTKVESAYKWNKSTQEDYGVDIEPLPADYAERDNNIHLDCEYVCPHCKRDIDGEELKRVGYEYS